VVPRVLALYAPQKRITQHLANNILQGSAKIWIRAGAEGVVIAGRRRDVLEKAAAEMEELAKGDTKILSVVTDITKVKDTDNLFEQVNKTFGRPADVVLSNAGFVSPMRKPHEESTETWWTNFEANMLGTHNMAVSFIRSQPDPKEPLGTFISTNSGLAAIIEPGMSGYSTAKLAAQRYIEYLATEYPTLRTFTLFPGIVVTDLVSKMTRVVAIHWLTSGRWIQISRPMQRINQSKRVLWRCT
jgi:NAD(P)-dependent dehydrogenase (short-subunit alcohol dehydrogenase family)